MRELKHIIIAAMLLMAVPAWAETDKKYHKESGLPVDRSSLNVLQRCVNGKCVPVEICLDKMEHAMRAMEPYQSQEIMGHAFSHTVYKDVSAFKKASSMWNDTKRDCWKEINE